MIRLVEQTKETKISGEAETYAGDDAAFSIEAQSAAGVKFMVAEYADGRAEIRSQAGRDLVGLSADICGMKRLLLEFALGSYIF